MTDLTSCLSLVETRPGVFWPCVREHGHEGPHNPGACGLPYHYAGGEYACTLMRGHAGACVSWVEQADVAADYDRDAELEREREQATG